MGPLRRPLPRDAWERLKARGTERGLTPSGVLLSAFAESWVAAIVFGAVAVGLFAIGRAGGKRRV